MADTISPDVAAKNTAIKNLQAERASLVKSIADKQARIGVIDVQLNALMNGPTTTVAPASKP